MPSILVKTRLHSSRMRTARALTVSPSMLCARGCLLRGGLLLGGSAFWGGLLPGEGDSCSRGGIPVCTEADPPLTESQTPVKTLPCPNFVAGGNKCTHKWTMRHHCLTGSLASHINVIQNKILFVSASVFDITDKCDQ